MPFENPQAAAVPTRRSSRIRAAAAEAPAAGATAADSEANAPASPIPSLRRAARQKITVAEAVALVAALTADDAPSTTPVAEARPSVVPDPTPSSPIEPKQEAPADPFEQASRAFRSVAEDTVEQSLSASDPDGASEAVAEESPTAHLARRRPGFRKFVTVGATVGVMGVAGLLAVGMTLPAEAVAGAGNSVASASIVAASADVDEDDEQIQAFVTSSEVQNETVVRSEQFSAVSLVEVASEQGIKFSDTVFSNDPDAAIQWPFLVGVGMSSGYGPRWGRMHEGIDFVPGEGAPIQAIADGTVRIATEQGGGYGVTVYIDHVIDGQVVTSHYSHMQYGSLKVTPGQTVKVGDIVGLTGNTGHSFGAHLHFEIIVNGSTIDPLPWLKANAGRSSLD